MRTLVLHPPLDDIVEHLIAGAEPVSAAAAVALRKVEMIEAWRAAVPYLEFRQRVSSLKWLSDYFTDIYGRWERLSPRGPSAGHIGNGKPSPEFGAAIDKVTKAATKHGMLGKDQRLPAACVLPLGTPNSMVLLLGDGNGGATRHFAYQLGLREFMRGMATIVLALEESLPFELFDNASPPSSEVWLSMHREAVQTRLAEESLYVNAAEVLLAQTLFGGYSFTVQRLLPFATTTQPLVRILCEYADYFMVGHQIGNLMAEHPGNETSTKVAGIAVTALIPAPEEEAIADLVGFTLSDLCLDPRLKSKGDLISSFALVAPDFHLSCLDCLECAVSSLGGSRAEADLHPPARERREMRRDILREWNSKPTLVLGQRLQNMMDALLEKSMPLLANAVSRGITPSYVWSDNGQPNLRGVHQ